MNFYFASGDFEFFWREQIHAFSWLPTVFQTNQNFGYPTLQSLWLTYPFQIIVKSLSLAGLSWFVIEKLLWLGIFIGGIYASYKLATYVVNSRWTGVLSAIIYTTNTYALLLFGGGQLGVALSYAFSPWVLLQFIQQIDRQFVTREIFNLKFSIFKNSLKNGLWFALLVCFDLRLAYLVLTAIGLYMLLQVMSYGLRIRQIAIMFCYSIVFPLIVAALVHMFWILPMALVRGVSEVGQEYTNSGMLRFLSVADFSHALSLLHPNWPENFFGKVYFLQPEFLIVPILAFSSLVFIKHKTMSMGLKHQTNDNEHGKEFVYFFAFLSLIGTFLAKGVNPPFGGIYEWLFVCIPGFVMFRDPTKFYLYIAIGYSVLIPFMLIQIVQWIRFTIYDLRFKNKASKFRLTINCIVFFIFVLFWCFTIRPLFLGQLFGNFKPIALPSEYTKLKDMLVSDKKQSRTLWIPRPDSFAFYSDTHPLLSADTVFNHASPSAMIQHIKNPSFAEIIRDGGVKYIVVPMDVEQRIFLSDYSFDRDQRDMLIKVLMDTGLVRLPQFTDIAVFENSSYVFTSEVPVWAKKQSYWANVGLGISIVFLFSSVVWLFFSRKKYGA